MFESILNTNGGSLSIQSALICMATALILGLVVAYSHKILSKGSKNFIISLAVLPLLVEVIITMVNGNLGTSVAILGAFSLIRFRSAPGNAKELVSIFLAMAIGLATAMGYVTFAITFTLIAIIAIAILSKINIESKDMLLKITVPEDLDYTNCFNDIFSKYSKKTEFIKSKTVNMGSMYEIIYNLELSNLSKQKEFIDELRCRNGNLKIILERMPENGMEL